MQVVKAQATVRGFLAKRKFKNLRYELRWKAARVIQNFLRNNAINKKYAKERKVIAKLQSMILSRRLKRAF